MYAAQQHSMAHQLNTAFYHNLREPLRVIAGLSQVLQENLPENTQDGLGQYSALIASSANRLQDMLRGVHEFIQIDEYSVKREKVDLFDLLQELRNQHAPLTLKNDARIHISSLPTVETDAGLIKYIMSEIMLNFLSLNHKKRPEMHISCKTRGNVLEVYIDDNGQGVPPEIQGKLFSLFQSHRMGKDHMGLGLARAAKIAARLGGHLSYAFLPEECSRFTLQLPLSMQ